MSVVEETTVPPACPASPRTTAEFCRERWRVEVDAARWAHVLKRRERVIRGLRAAGDARAADASGWLSLSAVLAGLPARTVGTVLACRDAAALVDRLSTAASDGFGPFRPEPDGPPGRHVAPDGLEVIDAGSRNGWAIADMCGRAASGDVVPVAGHPMTPSSLRDLLRRRLDAALDRAGHRP